MGEPFYFFLLLGVCLLLVYLIYRRLKPKPDSVSGLEAMTMNEDHYHSPQSGGTLAAIRDKRDGVVPVKRELDPNPDGLVATHFGGPKFDRDKPGAMEPVDLNKGLPGFNKPVELGGGLLPIGDADRNSGKLQDLPELREGGKAPARWDSNRTPRKNRGYMSEPPRRPPANDTSDSGDSD